MAECKTYNSLFALVDRHLAKLSLQEDQSNEFVQNLKQLTGHSSRDPDIILTHTEIDNSNGTPRAGRSESPIANILAKQMNDMFLSGEKKNEDSDSSLKNEAQGNDFVIDFSQSIAADKWAQNKTKVYQARPYYDSNDLYKKMDDMHLSTAQTDEDWDRSMKDEAQGHDPAIDFSQSVTSGKRVQNKTNVYQSRLYYDFESQLPDCEEDIEKKVRPDSPLPRSSDISFIVKRKQLRGKSYGKVLSSRLKPIARPYYFRERCHSRMQRFAFNAATSELPKQILRKPILSTKSFGCSKNG